MAGIKRTPADIAFSRCVRERANWTCQRCGTRHDENSRGLDCSHHHGRGNWAIRFDPLNAEALCTACHFSEGGTQERREAVLTVQEQEILLEKKRDQWLGKEYRKTKGKGAIARHYREELKLMQECRKAGDAVVDFVGWL